MLTSCKVSYNLNVGGVTPRSKSGNGVSVIAQRHTPMPGLVYRSLEWFSAGVLPTHDVNEHLLLSECNRPVNHTEEKQPYPDHPDRSDEVTQAQSSFTPEVIKDRIGISYRFTFLSSGLFQCSLTGLIFNVTHEGEVMYKTLIWDEMLLQPANKVPGGLLFSIKCSQDSISQLHLPHCEPEPVLVSKSLSVVHITDDGMSFIQPREITKTHVVVDTPHLTAFGIVWDLVKRFKNFITKPVKVQHEECEYIKTPSHCLLHKGQIYSLFSDPDVYTIQPSHATFFDNYGPNYHATFEIFMKTSTEEVTLMVQDPNRTQVWENNLHLRASFSRADDNQPKKNISAEEKLRRAGPHFIDQVSDPVLNKLLDELLRCSVLSDAEGKAARGKPRAEKARDLIDMVRSKGAVASSTMITLFSDDDPFLCRDLSLV